MLGTRAGRVAAAGDVKRFDGDIAHRTGRAATGSIDMEDLRKALVSRMWRCAGIAREREGLMETTAAIARWRHFVRQVKLCRRGGFELENLLVLGDLVTHAASLREESRGTHSRTDFPERDEERFLGSFSWRAGKEPEFRALEIAPHG